MIMHPTKGLIINRNVVPPAVMHRDRSYLTVSKDQRIANTFIDKRYSLQRLTDYTVLDDTLPDAMLPLEFTAADYKRALIKTRKTAPRKKSVQPRQSSNAFIEIHEKIGSKISK